MRLVEGWRCGPVQTHIPSHNNNNNNQKNYIQFSNSPLAYLLKERGNTNSKRFMLHCVYFKIIYNQQNMEATCVSL